MSLFNTFGEKVRETGENITSYGASALSLVSWYYIIPILVCQLQNDYLFIVSKSFPETITKNSIDNITKNNPYPCQQFQTYQSIPALLPALDSHSSSDIMPKPSHRVVRIHWNTFRFGVRYSLRSAHTLFEPLRFRPSESEYLRSGRRIER